MVFPEAMLGKVGRFDPPDLQIDESPLEEPIKAATSFAPVVKSASPCVVSIQTVQERSSAAGSMDLDAFRRFFDPEGRFPMPEERDLPAQGTGSGVIVSSDGFILTNFHVVEGTQSISVVLADGTTSLDAEIVGADKHSDLAVLKVQRKGLSAITLGNSDHLEVGDVVLAIGNPYGFGHSVSQGIVSGVGRFGLQLSTYEGYIQTDATIHLGSSGGALIDHQGRLVGINTLIYTAGTERNGETPGIGINLATPSTLAAAVLDDIVKYGHVIRGWLGVSVEVLLSEQLAEGPVQQLIVTDLAPGGPAQRAGIKLNDIIVAMDGEPVVDGRAAMLQIAQLRPGHLLRVNLDREGVPIELEAVVGTRGNS